MLQVVGVDPSPVIVKQSLDPVPVPHLVNYVVFFTEQDLAEHFGTVGGSGTERDENVAANECIHGKCFPKISKLKVSGTNHVIPALLSVVKYSVTL
jgi:hypothetical protein